MGIAEYRTLILAIMAIAAVMTEEQVANAVAHIRENKTSDDVVYTSDVQAVALIEGTFGT